MPELSQGARYSPLRQVIENTAMVNDKRNMGVLMVRRKEAVSPHTLMGLSCLVLVLLILASTAGLVMRRHYRSEHI